MIIRKNGPKSETKKRQEARAASAYAGEWWDWDALSRSYMGCYNTALANQRKFVRSKLLPWNKLEDIHRLFISNEYMVSNPELTALQFSFNLSPKTEQRLNKSNDINYPRDLTRKAFRGVLGENQPVYFWLLDEFCYKRDPEGRLHYHGVIGIPNELANLDVIAALTKALQASSLTIKRREKGNNRKAFVGAHYEQTIGENIVSIPVDSGFLSYTLKSRSRRKITNPDSKVKREQPNYCISKELRRDAGETYRKLRCQLKGG